MYIYLIMEYCQLADLAQFMKKRQQLTTVPETEDYFRRYPNVENGGLNEVMTRHFFKQMTSALQYLRSMNLIHRDIKPQNLLLNPAPAYWTGKRQEDIPMAASAQSLIPTVGLTTLPQLKIADFGFARHLPSTSMAETLCGSPLYMAPEILRYEKYDARSDLWSAGTVLYEMVVGKPPFRAQNHVDLLRKIEKANDVIPFERTIAGISRDVKNCARGLLTKNPLERMTYEELFECPLIVDDIPNLAPEDRPQQMKKPEVSELSRNMAQAMESTPKPRSVPEQSSSLPTRTAAEEPRRTSRKSSDQDMRHRTGEDQPRRKASFGSQNVPEGVPIRRQPSQREHREHRRPSMVPHITAPGRQELHHQGSMGPPAPIQRRASRSSPLAGPPLVREPTLEAEDVHDERSKREARERTASELTFEKEYVVIEKRAVEVNAFADELDAVAAHAGSSNRGAIVRRATTQGQPTSVTGAQPASPSRAMQVASGRTHHRAGSFERRYAPSPQSATNMLTKALNAANVRLFGGFGTSPPFSGLSPPQGYSAFPAYPTTQGAITSGDGKEHKTPMDEDSKLVRVMEDAAHRGEVIFGFAEVKYRQLLPATPSAQDALGIQQIGAQGGSQTDDDPDMTTLAIVSVAEEALVLYVKALATLTKTIDLAGQWWNKRDRSDAVTSDPSSNQASNAATRILGVVKWSRTRFNECLEKSEVVGRRLQLAQRQLPEDHPSHPDNQSSYTGSGGVTTSAEQIHISSGINAERLMFDRAVELSRSAAVGELVGNDFHDSDINYKTAIMLFEAVLDTDDEPLIRKPGTKSQKAGEDIVNGMETEDRQTVMRREYALISIFSNKANILLTVLESARNRSIVLSRKIIVAQQNAKRATTSGSSTPKPGTPVTGISNTPPRAA